MVHVHMNERTILLPPELGRLSTFIDSRTECLAGSSSELRSIALFAAKHIFDWALKTEKLSKPHIETLLATLTEAAPPQTRSQARSRGSSVKKPQKKVDIRGTPLPSLFIEDMNIDQIWQQLDLRAARVCENLKTILGDGEEGENANFNGEGSDNDASEDEDEDEEGDEEMGMGEDETVWEELSDEEENGSSTAEVVSLRDETSEEEDHDHASPTSMLDVVRGQKPSSLALFSRGRSDLDDGFFDLVAFNAETSELEGKKVYKTKQNSIADEDPAEEIEVDIFGSVDDESTGHSLAPTELFYNDFFEPPSRVENRHVKSSKVRFHERVSVKKIKAVGKGMPVSSMDDEDSDEEEET